MPETVKTDNGSDFVARETQRLLAALGIEHETARPFSPEQKGHIERAIGTMQRGLMRTLPGFVGHSVADRKVIEGRKSFAQRLGEDADDAFEVELSAAELQQCARRMVRGRLRPAAACWPRRATPFEVAASAAGSIRRVDDPRARHAARAGRRQGRHPHATKSGLRIEAHYYIAGFLDVGAEVMVRMDPADLGRAYVFDCDGHAFLGEAICPDLAGIDPAAAIA